MSITKSQVKQRITAIDIVFACSVCQIPLFAIDNTNSEGLHGDVESDNHKVPKLWFAVPCAHLSCAKHFEGGGIPFYPQGQLPRAPCPRCTKDKGDQIHRVLYYVNGTSKSDCHPNIPDTAFQTFDLMKNDPGSETLRFHYLSLARFGLGVFEKNKDMEMEIEELKRHQVSHPHQLPYLLRSSGKTDQGDSPPPLKRQRLMETELSPKAYVDGNAGHSLLNLSMDEYLSPRSRERHLRSFVINVRKPYEPDNSVQSDEEGNSVLVQQSPSLFRKRTNEATSPAKTVTTSTYNSPLHYSNVGRAATSTWEAPTAFKPISKLSLNNGPIEHHSTAFSYNPKQATISAWGQQTTEHSSRETTHYPTTANPHSSSLHHSRLHPEPPGSTKTPRQNPPLPSPTHPHTHHRTTSITPQPKAHREYFTTPPLIHQLQRSAPDPERTSSTLLRPARLFSQYLLPSPAAPALASAPASALLPLPHPQRTFKPPIHARRSHYFQSL